MRIRNIFNTKKKLAISFLFLTTVFAGSVLWLKAENVQSLQTDDMKGLEIFTKYQKPKLKKEIEPGDTVEISYVAREYSGKEFERKANLKLKAGFEMRIKGLGDAVIGLEKGSKKTVKLNPGKAYGTFDKKKIIEIPRVTTVPRFKELSSRKFKQTIKKDPVMHEYYTLPNHPWPIRVTKILNNRVTIDLAPSKGHINKKTPAIIGKNRFEVSAKDLRIIMEARPKVGSIVTTNRGRKGKILISDDEKIKLDFNHPMAGKSMIFDLKVVKYKKRKLISLSGLTQWGNFQDLDQKSLQKKYIKLLNYTKSYIIREEIKKIVIPSGVPDLAYGNALKVRFDADKADKMIKILRKFEDNKLNKEQLKRYVKIGRSIACEYCCSVRVLVNKDGTRACGCAHSYAMRGLTKYLILNSPELSNDVILEELSRWKALFFPKQSIQKMVKSGIGSGNIDMSLLQEMPDMVGGC